MNGLIAGGCHRRLYKPTLVSEVGTPRNPIARIHAFAHCMFFFQK